VIDEPASDAGMISPYSVRFSSEQDMCGRFKAGFEFRELKVRWRLQNDLFDFHPRYNIAPTQKHRSSAAASRS